MQDDVETQLRQHIDAGAIPPFVYSYPPRSAYRRLQRPRRASDIWLEERDRTPGNDLNLYLHMPFCRYKCGFCNLYTITSDSGSLHDRYVHAVCGEIRSYATVVRQRRLRTIYFGGGTPTLLKAAHFDQILTTLADLGADLSTVEEFCTEASPDSVAGAQGEDLLHALTALGLNRVNLGIESMDGLELKHAGRSAADISAVHSAVASVRVAGVRNLSVDLIMGFAGQSDSSWRSSVLGVLELAPETISTYFLTIRPDAWFSRIGRYGYDRDPLLYTRYDFAREQITGAGYRQESNVRYRTEHGGYVQKMLQFAGVPVLGVGLGARTYTNTVDYLRNVPLHPTSVAMRRYLSEDAEDRLVDHGFLYDDEERIRKRLVLDLMELDTTSLLAPASERVRRECETVIDAALRLGLAERTGDTVFLTPTGIKYRDILSWQFFSDLVRERDAEFYEALRREPPGRRVGA